MPTDADDTIAPDEDEEGSPLKTPIRWAAEMTAWSYASSAVGFMSRDCMEAERVVNDSGAVIDMARVISALGESSVMVDDMVS